MGVCAHPTPSYLLISPIQISANCYRNTGGVEFLKVVLEGGRGFLLSHFLGIKRSLDALVAFVFLISL